MMLKAILQKPETNEAWIIDSAAITGKEVCELFMANTKVFFFLLTYLHEQL